MLALCIAALATPITSWGEDLTIKDIMGGRYASRQIQGVHPLADGESYAQIANGGSQIQSYWFKNGEKRAVVFDCHDTKGSHIDRIDGYVMSPDEKTILIQTNTRSIYRRSFTAVYYIYDVASRQLTPLSKGGAQQVPTFSPDGTMVAFVRDGNIFLTKLLFGNAEIQVTKDGEYNKVINGIPDWVYEEEFVTNSSLVFTSDSKMLVWIRYDESQVKMFSFPWYKGLNPAKEEYALYPGEYTYKYPMAGEDNSKVSVLSFDIKAGNTRVLKVPLDEDGYIPRVFSTSEVDKVAVVTQNRHQDRLEIYIANARSTESRLIMRDEVDKYFTEDAYGYITFYPGGFLMCSERDGYNHIYQYTLTGQLKRQVTKGKWVVTELYGIDPKTGDIYYGSREESPLRKSVYKIDAKGKTTRLSTRQGTNTATFSASMRYYMNVWSDINTPHVTTLCDNTGRELKVMEDNAPLREKLASVRLGTREFFQFTTSEGAQLNGFMVKPADFDPSNRYPVVMFQYSGPGSQQVLDQWYTGNGGGALFEQYMAQQGIISVVVDGRGTGGRGAEWEKCTYLNLGDLESRDQVETALYLGTLPYVKSESIGIWGWSYGGFMTLMSMSEGRPVFAAGVAVAPPTSYRYYDTVYTERFMRTPKENEAGYNRNPITRADKLHGKLLICHGLADDNVHFRNTAEYTEALVQADKDFRMLTYTNRNHSIFGANTRNHIYRQIAQHFMENLK